MSHSASPVSRAPLEGEKSASRSELLAIKAAIDWSAESPSDAFWSQRAAFIIGPGERLDAIAEGARMYLAALEGVSPAEAAEAPWSDESWERLNQAFTACAVIAAKTLGAQALALPKAAAPESSFFAKEGAGALRLFFKVAMGLPQRHMELAAVGLLDQARASRGPLMSAPEAKALIQEAALAAQAAWPDRPGAGAKAQRALEKGGRARALRERLAPNGLGGQWVGSAHVGAPNPWELCQAMLEAQSVAGQPRAAAPVKPEGGLAPKA